MGFYQDPYSKYGELTYEMWRAIRLVLDTGIHSMGWSRQQAIDYFLANSSKAEHDITVEVDRYIVMPGQALAYKIGQLKFKELRAYASQKLGSKFDVRKFHDEVLDYGVLPMDVLTSASVIGSTSKSNRESLTERGAFAEGSQRLSGRETSGLGPNNWSALWKSATPSRPTDRAKSPGEMWHPFRMH